LPTARNFPFHPATGNHTSTLMSESLVGVIVSRTRQNARGALNGAAPAATISVLVILAPGIATPARFSHDGAAETRTRAPSSVSRMPAAVATDARLRRARILRNFIADFL
jgi:hypothetical protein